jgi:hypothetical protein
VLLAFVAALAGVAAAVHYHRAGLALTHYDARGHLIVARRIVDSITPGWQQIGAVWLPLPHLLNAIPVQLDVMYRTGASAIAISIVAFAVATGSIGWIVLALSESIPAAAAGAAVFALNPNVLYLQSTPMTEPLLMALTTLSIAMSIAWCRGISTARFTLRTFHLGILFALACLTRYEAWPVIAVTLVGMLYVRWREGDPLRDSATAVATIALYPLVAIAAFAVFSRVVIGEWLLAGGFFVPENKALGLPVMAASEIVWGVRELSGTTLVWTAMAGAIVLVVWLTTRTRADAALPLALFGAAAIPFSAFVDGHPFRIRYMVPLIAVQAIASGIAAGAVRRVHVAGALVLAGLVAYELRPIDASAPMVVEAQWDRPNGPERARVTACLGQPGTGKIMASMGSLGHYMQEASRSGFAIRDFLHEGNGDIWLAALDGPRPFADWVMIEEKAEGGDMLAALSRARPSFLDGYARVCEGAGLALYKRLESQLAGR